MDEWMLGTARPHDDASRSNRGTESHDGLRNYGLRVTVVAIDTANCWGLEPARVRRREQLVCEQRSTQEFQARARRAFLG